MKILFTALLCTLALAAHAKEDPEQTRKEIAQHRAIATAHETAAKCKESGKDEEICHAKLTKSCKGLAIGKLCGMKHQH